MRVLSLWIAAAVAWGVEAPRAHADSPIFETTYPGQTSGETIHVIAGEIEPGQEDALNDWLSSRLNRDGSGTLPYFEITPVELTGGREPQAIQLPRVRELAQRFATGMRATILRPVTKVQQKFATWSENPDNRLRLGFAVVATAVDGSLNSATMMFLQGTPAHSALAVGASIALLSGAWSFSTPEIARFLAGNPSLVDRIATERQSIARQGGKMVEGLFKWGLIQFAVMSAISAVSQFTGVADFASMQSWLLSNATSAAMMTLGTGTLDFSVNFELDQALSSDALTAREKNKALFKAQFIGTTAATLGTLGGVASMMGLGFGNILLYGLMAAGVTNLGRVEWREVLALNHGLNRRCSGYLLTREQIYRNYPNHGSE